MILSSHIGWYKYSLIVFIVLILASQYYQSYSGPRNALKAHFKGAVDDVSYDAKGNPSVYVNHKKRDIYWMTWHRDCIIHKGDTLIKNKGDLRLRLIRANQRDTIFFDDAQ